MYYSIFTVLGIMALAAPLALTFGFGGMFAKRSSFPPLKAVGLVYTNMVRGIPDIVFFLFVPLAIKMLVEVLRHYALCPQWDQSIFQGINFVVCPEAKFPGRSAPAWAFDTYNFLLAAVAYAMVFGAFAANVLDGALRAVPPAQIETAKAYGFTPRQTFLRVSMPQMWVYALPGLNNLWVLLIKATPLLFLLGIEDLVFWARELGGAEFGRRAVYKHPDWRAWYFLGLLVFYLSFTWVSQWGFDRISRHVSRGMASIGQNTAGGK